MLRLASADPTSLLKLSHAPPTAPHCLRSAKLGNFRYLITDATQFDSGAPPTFTLSANRPALEQSAFVQDLLRMGNWTINAGLRWDHHQLLVNKHALDPRLSISRILRTSATPFAGD